MADSAPSYTLRAELRGHDEDVRALLVCTLGLFTGSRDRTIKLWKETETCFGVDKTYMGHASYVTALHYIPAGVLNDFPDGALVSGSRDTTVKLWNPSTCECLHTLSGHKYQVTDLSVGPEGSVVSASLDSTLRVWKGKECAHVLEGHEGAVQCVVHLPSGDIVSGSNDTTIRVWRDGKCMHVITGHTDTVRGLAVLPGLGVVSASHDQTLRVWTFAGDCLATLCGHNAIIYRAALYCRAATLSSGLIASAAEDNTARLWQADGTALQSIEHPGCVWDVAFLPNGDLVTACADYAARVWTQSKDNAAPADIVEAYEAAIAERKAAAAAGSDSGSGLPEGLKLEPETSLLQPGKKVGDMKVIQEDGTGMVYTWDADKQQWEKVGEVVGGPAQRDTMDVPCKWHNGQQYDFVVDVDFEEGVPPKKLAFNRSDNPYNVAERFLAEEGLPMTYREQVVNYILNLMGRDSALPPAATANVDPFTSSGAYVPGASAFSAPGSASQGSDPFTSSGAYVPGPTTASPSGAIGSFSGQGASPHLQHIPATTCIIFNNIPKLEGIKTKLMAFNSMLSALPEKCGLALGEAEVAPGCSLDTLLARAVEACTNDRTLQISAAEFSILQKLLCWPASQLFPALDITRMLVLSPPNADALAALAGGFQPSQSGGIGGALAVAASEPQLPGNLQTGLRLACNLFKHAATEQWIQGAYMAIIDAYSPAGSSSNKAVRSSWASFLVNVSVTLCAASKKASTTSEEQAVVLSAVAELLGTCPEDDYETLARAFLAAGTIMHSGDGIRSVGRDLGIAEQAERYKASSNAKVASVAGEVARL